MRRSFLLLASLLILGYGVTAVHASTITADTYSLENAYINGYSVTGTVTLNSTGRATAAGLTFNDPNLSNSGLPYFNWIAVANAYNGLSQNYISSSDGQVALYFNTTTNANGFFDLCLGSAQCGTSTGAVNPSTLQVYGFYNSTTGSNPGLASTRFSSGYLAPINPSVAALSPEPPSLLLLGTGLLVISGAGWFLNSRSHAS